MSTPKSLPPFRADAKHLFTRMGGLISTATAVDLTVASKIADVLIMSRIPNDAQNIADKQVLLVIWPN
jgi:hypothetical protein